MSAAFRLSTGDMQNRLKLSNQPPPPPRFTEKYRPRQLADVVGQGAILFRIEAFLETPYSTAMLFEGPTGVGKTTVARAIAAELGAVEFGGLEEIKSGMQDQEAVLRALDILRYTPMMGSGWKVLIADEADMMSTHAQRIWLSAIEDLPQRSVVIFTTNNPEKFPDRFLDRCERFQFEADAATHLQDAQALVDRIWHHETSNGDAPRIESLPSITDRDGHISYRRVVEALKPLLDARKAGPLSRILAPVENAACETLKPPGARRGNKSASRVGTKATPAVAVSAGSVSIESSSEPAGPPDAAVGVPRPEPDAAVAESPADVGPPECKPCVNCGTTRGGLTAAKKYERTRGRCQSCYNYYRRAGNDKPVPNTLAKGAVA